MYRTAKLPGGFQRPPMIRAPSPDSGERPAETCRNASPAQLACGSLSTARTDSWWSTSDEDALGQRVDHPEHPPPLA